MRKELVKIEKEKGVKRRVKEGGGDGEKEK